VYPQVALGRFASFRVVKSSVSAGHDHFWGGFDSRQLSLRSAKSGPHFPSTHATPLRNRNLRRSAFDSAVDSAVEALGLKSARHNFARDTAESLAIQEGASVVAAARLLGHESAASTLNDHAGLFPTDLDDIASRLNPALASSGRCLVGDSLASDVARWLPIVNRAAAANTSKPSRTCANTRCPVPGAPVPGAPGTTRTCDLGIRRPLLYPPELRRQCAGQSIQLDPRSDPPAATRTKSVSAPQLSVMVCASTHAQHRLVNSR
jgi:hypothetical protein